MRCISAPRVFEGYTVFDPLLRKREFASVIDSIDFLYSLMALFLMNRNYSVMRFLSSLLKLALNWKCFSQVIHGLFVFLGCVRRHQRAWLSRRHCYWRHQCQKWPLPTTRFVWFRKRFMRVSEWLGGWRFWLGEKLRPHWKHWNWTICWSHN